MFGGGADFGGDFMGPAMAASFKEFLARPENAALVEKHQRREVRQALQAQERARALGLRDALLGADLEAQAAVAPFLRTRVLRRVVQTFANDAAGDFGRWAANPRVIGMLRAAQAALDEGRMEEAEMEEYLVRRLRDPAAEGHAAFAAATTQVARLPTDQLVGALNEHLAERRKGNAAYRAGRPADALPCYERALAVVDLVRGLSRADQAEVDANRAAVLLNMAACHLALKAYGAAAAAAGEVLARDPLNGRALARRARARAARGEYAAAEADVAALRGVDAGAAERAAAELRRARAEHAAAERRAFRGVFARAPAAAEAAM